MTLNNKPPSLLLSSPSAKQRCRLIDSPLPCFPESPAGKGGSLHHPGNIWNLGLHLKVCPFIGPAHAHLSGSAMEMRVLPVAASLSISRVEGEEEKREVDREGKDSEGFCRRQGCGLLPRTPYKAPGASWGRCTAIKGITMGLRVDSAASLLLMVLTTYICEAGKTSKDIQ